jgi:hypothetical protein
MVTRTKYSNAYYFILIPLLVFLLVEWYVGFPSKIIGPEAKALYTEFSISLAGVVLFSSVIGMAINYWHFKKRREDQNHRKLHMIICILILSTIYFLGKLLVLGNTLPVVPFVKSTGFSYVNFRKLEKIQTLLLVVYFILQVVFGLVTMLRVRKNLITAEINNPRPNG